MRVVAINEAEAIIEPFWDGGTSELDKPDNKYGVISEYEVEIPDGVRARVQQDWASATIKVDVAPKGAMVARLSRKCNVSLAEYDEVLLFGTVPSLMNFDFYAELDGEWKKIGDKVRGKGETGEYHMPFLGTKLTGLRMEFFTEENHTDVLLMWLGAANREKVKLMERRPSPYDGHWNGYFKDEDGLTKQDLEPQIGILVGADELEDLRARMASDIFAPVYQQKKKKAYEDMQMIPEEYIGRHVIKADRRWCRDRDMHDIEWPVLMENLAFVGMVEGDKDMMKMACRHAISVSHCEYWCESEMGLYPGATWHHRSFTEALYCRAVSLIIDWAGGLMTRHALQVVREAIALKGLPRIESDFRRVEYIRYMNQGIVFNGARILAILSMMSRHPRYEWDLEQARLDHISMIENYMQADGGTLEGPHYWAFTFAEAMPGLYAVARQRGEKMTQYKELLKKSGDFFLSMLSTQQSSTVFLPVNDAHPRFTVPLAVVAGFCEITNDARWWELYQRLLAKGEFGTDIFALILTPHTEGYEPHIPDEEDGLFCATGQLTANRQGEVFKTNLHYVSGKTYEGHWHQDKGSIIIEVDGISVCPDPGIGSYHEASNAFLPQAQAHNIVVPVFADGMYAQQHRDMPGGKIVSASVKNGVVDFAGDETFAWEAGVVKQDNRRVFSPCPELIVVEDTVVLDGADRLRFVLNSNAPYTFDEEKGVATSLIEHVKLVVTPLNWKWEDVLTKDFMDGEHCPVYQMSMGTQSGKEFRLVTAITLEKDIPFTFEEVDDGYRAIRGGQSWEI